MSAVKNRFRITLNSPVILGFTALCLVALGLDWLTDGRATDLLFCTHRASLLDPLTYVRFFGHVLGHAGWDHLLNNLMYILILGPMLEEKYGSRNMLILMGATALITGLINFIFFPHVYLYGASGVVFAMILLSSFTEIEQHSIPATFILVAVLYIGQQVNEAIAMHDDISQMSHIAGGITGAALGFLLNSGKKPRRRA